MIVNEGNEPQCPILVVDDEIDALQSFDFLLRSDGLDNIILCSDGSEVFTILERNDIELLLLDLILSSVSGKEILPKVIERFPQIPVIVVTGVNDVEMAVQCMQKGAFDYVLKPLKESRLLPSIHRAIDIRQLKRENAELKECILSDSLKDPDAFSNILTQSPRMQTMFKYCEAIAKGRHPILITGETGVGKDLIAEAVHLISGREGDFVAVNVAGFDDSVFSDTLFGHIKGAFTDAASTREGLMERAQNGTLFLDEIGDLSPASQVKFLRLLDKHEYFPLGSDVGKPANVRFLFATHRDLTSLVKGGSFREDLFYRLQTHCVHILPLRERMDDLPILVRHFIGQAADEFGKKTPGFHRELISLLQGYEFPGNVRELKSLVFDAVGRNEAKMLSIEMFRDKIRDHRKKADIPLSCSPSIKSWVAQQRHFPTIKETTSALIQEALERARNNQRIAALMLGITPQALNQRVKKRQLCVVDGNNKRSDPE